MHEFPRYINWGVPLAAFTGPMASGKTYSAERLFPLYKKMSLAAPLKETARVYYGVSGKTNIERQILQELADDIKKWDNDVFTKMLINRVYNYYDDGGRLPVVVDDLRFPSEAKWLREYGFKIVRVIVPEETRMARIKEKYPDTDISRFSHSSEKLWKDIKPDFTIHGDNDTDIVELQEVLLRDI